ncbi:hypothetical protein HYT53_04565 [Candidatus Woesearchaeota archaeon]|nr:hypothetical protein [Candidatus Woesearchaeota archaeon]
MKDKSIFITILFLLAVLIISSWQYSEFLNKNSGTLMLIFTSVVALSSLTYSILTWRLVDETRQMRESQRVPNISIIIQPREEWINFIDMVIRNIGTGPAYDIKFEISKNLELKKGHLLSDKNFIKNGIKYLAPNQKLQFFLTSLAENPQEKFKSSFDIKVDYKDKDDNDYKEKFTIDFSELIGLQQLGDPPLHTIAKGIDSIKHDISLLTSGIHRIKAIVYTKKDIDDENKALMKHYEAQKNKENEKEVLKQ